MSIATWTLYSTVVNISKIISPLISLGSSLSADSNISVYVRDLGVFIDSDLGAPLPPPPSWKNRVTLLLCYLLRQLRHRVDTLPTTASVLLWCRSCILWLDYANFILVRLPAYLQRHLQAVLNAAARLVFRLRLYDNVTDALGDTPLAASSGTGQLQTGTHGISFTARYGTGVLESTRSGIGSAKWSTCPAVYRLSTISRRSFPVAASNVWNSWPVSVHLQSSPSLSTFRQRLKTFLFLQSFSDVVI